MCVGGGAEGKAGDPTQWRVVASGKLLGWTLQHTGTCKMSALWVRSAGAWYWLRLHNQFTPSTLTKTLRRPPGATERSALGELIAASPLAATYARPSAPPPRASLPAREAAGRAPYTAADASDKALASCPRALRLASWTLVGADGTAVDPHEAMPRGLLPVGKKGGAAPSFTLVGQLLPTQGQDEPTEGWPARVWVRSQPIHEWRSAVRREAGRGDGRGGHRRRQGEPAALDAVGRRMVRAAEALASMEATLSSGGLPARPAAPSTTRTSRARLSAPASRRPGSTPRRCRAAPSQPSAPSTTTAARSRCSTSSAAAPSRTRRASTCAASGFPRELLGAALLTKADGQGGAADEAAHGGGGSGVWVRTGAIVGGNIDYAVQPAAMWVRTHGAIYQLLRPAAEYAPHYSLPGSSRLFPLPEAQLRPLIELLARRDKHPFGGNKAAALPSLRLMNFEVCDPKAAPRSLVRTLPDGTLKAAQSAAGGADKGGDALHIYVRGQLLPAREGAARPWVWAGRCARGRPTTSGR